MKILLFFKVTSQAANQAQSVDEESEVISESTLLLLKKDIIEIVSLRSGEVIQQFSTLNLRDYIYSQPRNTLGFSPEFVHGKIISSHLTNGY